MNSNIISKPRHAVAEGVSNQQYYDSFAPGDDVSYENFYPALISVYAGISSTDEAIARFREHIVAYIKDDRLRQILSDHLDSDIENVKDQIADQSIVVGGSCKVFWVAPHDAGGRCDFRGSGDFSAGEEEVEWMYDDDLEFGGAYSQLAEDSFKYIQSRDKKGNGDDDGDSMVVMPLLPLFIHGTALLKAVEDGSIKINEGIAIFIGAPDSEDGIVFQ